MENWKLWVAFGLCLLQVVASVVALCGKEQKPAGRIIDLIFIIWGGIAAWGVWGALP